MGNPSSKSSFKNNNLSKQINFVDNQYSKYSGMKSHDRDNDVLAKFTWNYGGNSVYLTGSFNNWKKNIQMEKQGEQFCITLLLPRQVHQYKFIVDGEWRFSPEDATMSDDNGYINNYIDTTNFVIQGNTKTGDGEDQDLSGRLYQHSKSKSKCKDKKQQYAKYAPKLPPHYEYCLYLGDKNPNPNSPLNMSMGTYSPYSTNSVESSMMNNSSPNKKMVKIQEEGDENYQASLTQEEVQNLFKTPHCLPMPTHIVVDHVMTQQGEWYSAMAITQRFKQKYTTFTYYTIDRPTVTQETDGNQGHWIQTGINNHNLH